MLLRHSVFHEALFPADLSGVESFDRDKQDFALRRMVHFSVPPSTVLHDIPLILFDTETTGLDSELDRIIEFGALKIVGGKVVDEFWSFVRTDIELTQNIINLTGITQPMLEGQPEISEVLPKFLKFINGSIIVAHNAEFDMSMLKAAGNRLGFEIQWPCFCTLKLARKALPGLPRYNLDTLAEHFKLTFEARHRAVGDVKVLNGVLQQILEDDELGITTWGDVSDCVVA
jgi:DNA polymerase III epsilon subunit family exonuclease